MKKSVIFLVLILSLLGYSSACKRSDSGSLSDVIKPHQVDSIKLSDYFSEIRYVAFDTNPEAVFAEATKVLIHDDRIFVLDKIQNTILCFDTLGQYRFRIQRIGKGPGEYRSLDAFWIEPGKKQIWAHCRIPDKTLVFDWSGQYLNEWAGNRGADDRIGLSNGNFLSYAMFKHGFGKDTVPPGVFVSDEHGKSRETMIPIGKLSAYWSLEIKYHFFDNGDSIFFLSQSDSIFRFDQSGHFTVDCVLDWGDYSLPTDLKFVSVVSPRAQEIMQSESFVWKDQLLVSGPLRWFVSGKGRYSYLTILDKRDLSGVYSGSLYNDLSDLPVTFPSGYSNQGELLTMLDMDLIWAMAEYFEQHPPGKEHYDRFRDMMAFIRESIEADRPVLVRMRLKEEFKNKM